MRRFVAIALLVGAVLALAGAPPAGADVITPKGACGAGGKWSKAKFRVRGSEHSSSDVIEIPARDVVVWRGNLPGKDPGDKGARRDISGSLAVDLPLGQSITVKSWGGSTTKLANRARKGYNLPFFFKGVKFKLEGHHDEDGKRICSGSIYMKVKGSGTSNPLTWAGVVGVVLPAILLAVTRSRVLGALAGFVLGGSVGVLLLTLGSIPLESVVLPIAPFAGLVVGLAWGLLRHRGGSAAATA